MCILWKFKCSNERLSSVLANVFFYGNFNESLHCGQTKSGNCIPKHQENIGFGGAFIALDRDVSHFLSGCSIKPN